VAKVGRRADDELQCRADAVLAAIDRRAPIRIIANGTIEFHRIAAKAGQRIARASIVALVGGGARYRRHSDALTGLTSAVVGAHALVVAGGVVGEGWIRALSRLRIASSDAVANVERATRNGPVDGPAIADEITIFVAVARIAVRARG
jgi:hypothetical protein